ncbi:alkaline phosphatase family protein [Cellulosimicrobium cellulans]|uniref:alkaline phosphatase family protein n=1 Tax=Cellulosimicrobium TaxID=157920 RepID=UPI00088860A8|nr:nucleotide pyrophosphatase/phosphodiesterase family protein [Sphaerisporangium cinnabarinum]MCR1982527.1 alkaline phosphatase family protein [Cellulosimicrobium cellulans]PTU56439.1 alkaline phosphatase family protein [Sphaerisporangium cinnabarinum]SDF04837.1 Predicted pyrophosphatase or phosphodiesterase, AlkP superfamily [Cellulosimicrobium cellulans]
MKPVLLLDVVGLTSTALAHMPRLRQLAANGWQSELATVLPAVTCSVQSTMLTGLSPAEHGIVGNGWYFRELGDVYLWRQHNRLVEGEKLWEAARRARGEYAAANVCWWYAMGMTTDVTVTPRPVYHADGRKSPDAYVRPPALHDDLVGRFGEFPLFTYWGPTADITSSRWIVDATRHVLRTHAPDLTMAYVPHLDYDLQRFGPTSPQADAAAAELDATLAPLLDDAANQGVTVLVVSEYGIADADRPVHLNRILRREGLLEVYVQDGKEQLDPWTSRAFAVADHQVAHVYLGDQQDPALRRRVTDLLRGVPGVDEVLDREAQARYGLDHERSGDLVVVAEPGAWFTYYFWLDDARAPEYARGVDIHRKPGYDPAELFFDPADRLAKAKAGLNLVKKKVGLRYAMSTVPLDASYVKGSHGRLPDSSADTPLVLCSDPEVPASVAGVVENGSGQVPAAAIKGLVLELQGLGVRV